MVYGWNRSAVTLSASGEHTDHYLDPPVLGNYTNQRHAGWRHRGLRPGSFGFRSHYIFRSHRTQAAFEVPNENLQEIAGQRQDRTSREDLGQAAWTHEFSARLLLSVRAAVEDLSANLWSNTLATPIVAFQQRGFRRGYANATLAAHAGRHEIKMGADGYYAPVTEALQYRSRPPRIFDPGTPLNFRFFDHRLDREQAGFAQDTMRFGNLTLSAGLRWDHYSLVVRDHAWSPRLGAAWYWPKAGLVLRASYDRTFITPAMENLLLASSPQVDSVDPLVLRIPLRPSLGNFLETGFSKALFGKARLDASFYRRTFVNYADDDVFLNTGISFPIAFHSAQIRGVDVKLAVPHWGRFSGFLSYSNMIGIAQLPVAGGLFLGDERRRCGGRHGRLSRFPRISATRRAPGSVTRFTRACGWRRLRLMEADCRWISTAPPDLASLVAQYGQQIIDRVNFDAGRVRPNFTLDASFGADLWKQEKRTLRLQMVVENLMNRLNVINFAGLFSGTAIAAAARRQRPVAVRFLWFEACSRWLSNCRGCRRMPPHPGGRSAGSLGAGRQSEGRPRAAASVHSLAIYMKPAQVNLGGPPRTGCAFFRTAISNSTAAGSGSQRAIVVDANRRPGRQGHDRHAAHTPGISAVRTRPAGAESTCVPVGERLAPAAADRGAAQHADRRGCRAHLQAVPR